MNQDAQLKLQAYLDGELPDREAAEVKAWVAADAEAQQLLTELCNTTAALTGHEAGIKLPESGDFFWSKIRREIQQQESNPQPAPKLEIPWWTWLTRNLAPATSVVLLACVIAFWWVQSVKAPIPVGEMELASDTMGAYTFRDQEEHMTVVWFFDKSDSQFTQPAVFASMDGR